MDLLRSTGGSLAVVVSLACAACSGMIGEGDSGSRDVQVTSDARADVATDGSNGDSTTVPMDVVADTVPADAGMDATTTPRDVAVPMDVAMPMDVVMPVDVAPIDAGPSSTRHTARMLGYNGAPNGYWEYLPPGYGAGALPPVMFFWHGIGENGNGTTELRRVVGTALPQIIENDRWPNDRPFVVLSPQHSGGGCPTASEIHSFIAWALPQYRIDPQRVYLTALSCGAIGSWGYLNQYRAEQVSAAVLIAGDPGDPNQSWSAWGNSMCALGQVAIWAIHGDNDTVVGYQNENVTMNNLLACPMPPRRETHWDIIRGGSHFIWNGVYDLSSGYAIYDFMLRNPR